MAEHWNGGSGGKGSKPRPYSVDQDTFSNNWDAIFGKKKLPEAEKADTIDTNTEDGQDGNAADC